MSGRYGTAHRELRAEVLAEEVVCVGYPEGIHGTERILTTTLDHVEPLVRGGRTVRSNARGLCKSCNSRKGRDERQRSWRDR